MSKNKKEKKEKLPLSEEQLQKRKSRKTRVAISCFVLLLAVGVAGNWYWENSDLSANVSSISSAKEKILGEATYVDATTEQTTENSYFSSARVDRQNARDESLEKLQAIVDSQTQSQEAQKEAADKISKISDNITAENKIETLVKAKGVNNCIAVINDETNRVDIIVDVEDLTDTVILQIKEIATSQLQCSFEDVTIIQSK
ncbi:MAG: SpoIIIAH-like family protein [Eubacterium sp.]